MRVDVVGSDEIPILAYQLGTPSGLGSTSVRMFQGLAVWHLLSFFDGITRKGFCLSEDRTLRLKFKVGYLKVKRLNLAYEKSHCVAIVSFLYKLCSLSSW